MTFNPYDVFISTAENEGVRVNIEDVQVFCFVFHPAGG